MADVLALGSERLRALSGPLFDALVQSGVALLATEGGCGPDHPIVFVNRAWEALTGFPAADVLGRDPRFMQPPGHEHRTLGRLRRAVADGKPFQGDLLNCRQDSSLFWNRITITPVGDGVPDLFLATLMDVTTEHGLTLGTATGRWEWDIAGRRLHGDARFAELCGLEPGAAFLGLPTGAFFTNIVSEDRMRIRIAVAGVLGGAEVFSKEYRVTGRDGVIRWVAAEGRAPRDEPGAAAPRFSGALTDVTAQRRVAEQLRIAQSAGGVGSFEYEVGFGTANVSEQFCRLLGLQPAAALPVRTINSVVANSVAGNPAVGNPAVGNPAVANSAVGNLAVGAAAGDRPAPLLIAPWRAGARGEVAYVEVPIRRADTGEARWLARRGELVADDTRTGSRFVGVVYDVTAAKAAEAELRDFAQTLEQRVEERTQERDRLWNTSRDLFAVCDRDGAIRAANPAWDAVLGYPAEALLGARLRDLAEPDDRAAVRAGFDVLRQTGALPDLDIRLSARDGGTRWINWTGIAAGAESFLIGRDITGRRALEDQLRQSHKMEAVGQLTGGLAHDFNNMLTGIMGSMDIIGRRIATGRTGDVDRFLDAAMTSAQRAAALVHRLLAFSRRQSLDTRPTDVNALVGSMEELLRRTLGEQILLEVVLDGGTAMALTDANQLESAILNLAINARDAMPSGGRLTISTRNGPVPARLQAEEDAESGDYVVITVADTGAGMAPSVVTKAFDPFFTTKPIGQGTGLGLSMIYGFMRQTGGHARIASAPDDGTTISLYLKRAEAPADQPVARPRRSAPRGAGESILVVEDDPSVRMLVLDVLHELGYAALEAGEAEAALRHLRSPALIDLLITDVGLPGLNGRQLADMAIALKPELRVLFMTGYAEGAAVRAAFLGPAMAMISKPFSMETLAVKIREMVGS